MRDKVYNSGPKCEILTLLMNCLRTCRIFEGPDERKFITFDSAGIDVSKRDISKFPHKNVTTVGEYGIKVTKLYTAPRQR